jgi:hypothetical protein
VKYESLDRLVLGTQVRPQRTNLDLKERHSLAELGLDTLKSFIPKVHVRGELGLQGSQAEVYLLKELSKRLGRSGGKTREHT